MVSKFLCLVVFGWFVFTASSCVWFTANHGTHLNEEQFERIDVGVSRSQVIAILGYPTTVSSFDSNIWYYIGQKTERIAFLNPDITDAIIVTIQFDTQDHVQAIEQLDEQAINDIAFVDRETLTRGRTFSIFEQLFSAPLLRVQR